MAVAELRLGLRARSLAAKSAQKTADKATLLAIFALTGHPAERAGEFCNSHISSQTRLGKVVGLRMLGRHAWRGTLGCYLMRLWKKIVVVLVCLLGLVFLLYG